MKPVDIHVHMVGNGSGGTGCWLRIKGWQRPMARLMLRNMGLPQTALRGDLDRLFVERLLQLVRTSSLGAVVILAHERVYDEQGRLLEDKGSAYVPNDYVLSLARKHPEFLPAISIHPARPDALEELDRCLAAGAVMMKCLPASQNIDCRDRRYTKFWERIAEAGLPLLAHTGGEYTVEVVRPDLQDPRVLELPLQCGVTVIAAHCATKGGFFDPDYFRVFTEMLQRYPRLYGDTSAFNMPIRIRHAPECTRPPLVGRMLHGSDLPALINGHWAWMHGLVDWGTFRRWERHPNALERDYQLKRALGFPNAVFTRAWGILRLNGGKREAAAEINT